MDSSNSAVSPITGLIKPTVDHFMKINVDKEIDDVLCKSLAKLLDEKLTHLGYERHLVRVLEPDKDGTIVILVVTQDERDRKDAKFTITAITIRADTIPEELRHND